MAQEYLKRTPTSTGNRKIFTYAGWFKKNNADGSTRFDIFNAYNTGSQAEEVGFRQDALRYLSSGSSLYGFDTTNKYRDTGNWFHIVFALNTTLESERKRSVIYINGVEVDTTTSSGIGAYVAKNFDSIAFNVAGKEHNVLARKYSSSGRDYVEGGGFDIFFVDGQALTPDVFGFFKEGKGYQSSGTTQATDFRPGQWVPKSPRTIKTEINRRGGFGVNGFYLPMNDSSNFGADFHCAPDSIIKLKGEDLPQPRNGAPTTSDAYVSQLRTDSYASNIVLAVPGVSTATGSNLVTNGTFDTNTTGWTSQDATLSVDNGRIKVLTTNTNYGSALQTVTGLTVGQRYTFQVDMYYGNASLVTAISGASPSINSGWQSADYVWRTSFTATTTSLVIDFQMASQSNVYGFWDNVILKAEDAPRDYSADIKGSGTNKTITAYDNAGVGYELGGYYGSAMTFDGATDYLATSLSAMGTNDFTIEFWVYPKAISGSYVGPIGLTAATTVKRIELAFQSSTLQIYTDTGAWRDTGFAPPTNQWTHIALEKYNGYLTVYANGVAVWTVTNTRDYDESFNVKIGKHVDTLNGYMQDVRVYSGVAKYKGGFDVPKPYTPVGFEGESWRQVSDNCKNNFATLNPEFGVGRQDQLTYSNGNLRVVSSATSGSDTTAPSNMAIKGKIYCEFALTDDGIGAYVGVMKYNTALTNNGVDTTASSDCWLIRGDNEHKANGDGGGGASYGSGTWSTGDIIMMAVDIDNTSIWFGKNGTWYASGNPATNSNAAYTNLPSTEDLLVMCGDNYSSETPTIDVNFGQNPTFGGSKTAGTYTDASGKGLFKYAPPTGFLALCEDNLPTPAIADPGDYFKTVLWTGDGNIGRSITGVGFKPDLVWIKSRTSTVIHYLFDTIRGAHNGLDSSSTTAEVTSSTWLQSFDDNGFSLGTSGGMNGSGNNYVGWCWKAGGAAVANTDGSINSSVSVNQTAGFSIVSYTGTGSAGTVGHGLGKRPKVVIVKRRDASTNWPIFFDGISNNTNDLLQLNLTNATATAGNFFNSGNTTTTTFPLGTGDGQTNESGSGHIAYCWAEIEGYSKFGSYRGNGNGDGPFVYCGFKPAWLMVKSSSNSGTNWRIWDSSRGSTNPNNLDLLANTTHIENAHGSDEIDLLSNGFKIRSTGSWHNLSGGSFVFMAFAESPFQTANAK